MGANRGARLDPLYPQCCRDGDSSILAHAVGFNRRATVLGLQRREAGSLTDMLWLECGCCWGGAARTGNSPEVAVAVAVADGKEPEITEPAPETTRPVPASAGSDGTATHSLFFLRSFTQPHAIGGALPAGEAGGVASRIRWPEAKASSRVRHAGSGREPRRRAAVPSAKTQPPLVPCTR